MSLSSALSITHSVGVPRTAYVDYPLGRTAGKADDPADQLSIVRGALRALVELAEPGQTMTLRNLWSADESWKEHAMRPGWTSDGLRPAGGNAASDDRAGRSNEPQWQLPDDKAACDASANPTANP